MRTPTATLLIAIFVVFAVTHNAVADEAGPPPSYGAADPDHQVVKTVENLLTWARGELAEHEGEGLFESRPAERESIEGMIAWAEELRNKAKAAGEAGDPAKARIFYLSAEATARYAANMPHLLEARLEGKH